MIKVNKIVSNIPDSLRLPTDAKFAGNPPKPPITTHLKRMEVVNALKYIDENKYNSRYKQKDTKDALKSIYNNKCAYCEKHIEQSHVEHYRPKKNYYWLAFSWDNLILACSTCNGFKGTNFEIQGTPYNFQNTNANILKLHSSITDLDLVERPKMVNPEITDPKDKIDFHKDGLIKSSDICFAYTINKCQIDRKPLNDVRRKILNDFKDNVRAELNFNKNIEDQEKAIDVLSRAFINGSQNTENEFLAFKRFAISSKWLNDIIKEFN